MRFSIKTTAQPASPIINRWTILHLPKRKDRMPLALSNAERLGVPRDIVHGFGMPKMPTILKAPKRL